MNPTIIVLQRSLSLRGVARTGLQRQSIVSMFLILCCLPVSTPRSISMKVDIDSPCVLASVGEGPAVITLPLQSSREGLPTEILIQTIAREVEDESVVAIDPALGQLRLETKQAGTFFLSLRADSNDSTLVCFNIIPTVTSSQSVSQSSPLALPPIGPVSAQLLDVTAEQFHPATTAAALINMVWMVILPAPGGGAGASIFQKLTLWDNQHGVASHTLLSVACHNMTGYFYERLTQFPHVQHRVVCVTCPDGFMAYSSATHLSALPTSLLEALQPLIDILRSNDVLVMVDPTDTDKFLMNLARLANPSILIVWDIPALMEDLSSVFPVDVITVPSVYTAMWLGQNLRTRAPLVAIPPAVDPVHTTEAQLPAPVELPSEFCGGHRHRRTPAIVFGLLARLSPEKAPGLFIHAASIVLKVIPAARFVMIGPPANEQFGDAITELIASYGLPPEKFFLHLGYVKPARFLSCMDVFVAPYLVETFGMALVEAMGMGIPVLHFNLGGIQDYARHLVNSYVVVDVSGPGLAAGMLALAANDTLRFTLSAGGLSTAALYSSQRIAKHGSAVIRRAVALHRLRATLVVKDALLVHRMKHSVAVQACSVATRSGTPLLLHCPPHADSVQPISSVDATQEYAVLQLILGVRVADVPVGFEDVLGRVTDDFPDRVGDMFLDWHHRRCVVCVRYAVEGSSHTMESCTSDLASAIVQDSAVSVCDVGDACSARAPPSLRLGIPFPQHVLGNVTTCGGNILCVQVGPLSVEAQAFLCDAEDHSIIFAIS